MAEQVKSSVIRAAPAAGKPKLELSALRPLDWSDLERRQLPERAWAIDGWLGMGHVTLLAGVGGAGKSLLAQALGSAISIGADFIGAVPQQRRVLFLACEDDADELHRRQIRIGAHFGKALGEFTNFMVVPRVGEDNTLVATEYGKPMWTPFFGELKESCNDRRVDTLIIDNLAQVFAASENDRAAVSRFVAGLSALRPGMAVLLLAHPAKAATSEFSGSSAWENAVRARWFLGRRLPGEAEQQDDGDGARYLCRRKANYAAADWLRLDYVDGLLVPAAAADLLQPDGRTRAEHGQDVVLAALRRLREMGRFPTDGATSPDYLPRLAIEFQLNAGLSRRDLAAAMRNLMVAGRLQRGVVGKYANRNDRFGLLIP